MRTRSRAQVAAIRAAGRRKPGRATIDYGRFARKVLSGEIASPYDVRTYFALKPEMYFDVKYPSPGAMPPEKPRYAPASAMQANDDYIRKLEDEIFARRLKR